MNTFKNILGRYCTVLVVIAGLAACSKEEEMAYPQDGGLAFYNASQLLQQDVQGNGNPARILLNANNPADTTYGVHMPDFRPSFGGSESQQIFPRKGISATSPPWLGFMHVRPGLQEISFLGTDSSFKLQTTVQTFTDRNIIVLLSDSMGQYHVTQAEENSNPGVQSVQLQVLHLSPDAGDLQVKVNDADWQTLTYRSQTGFRDLATPATNETFPLRIQVSANSEIASRTTINAMPGHSYTLVINGYYNSAAYTDKHTGEQVSILPNFRLSVVRNK